MKLTKMKCRNRKRCAFLRAYGYCTKEIGEMCIYRRWKKGE